MKENLWDDEAFKKRLAKAASRKGITVARALVEAGASRFYMAKPVDGRSTNTILNLAKVLDVPAAELFGFVLRAPKLKPKPEPELETPIVTQLLKETRANGNQGRQQRVTLMARMIAAQLAALVYVACSDAESDPKALMELVMREMNKDQPERGGKGQ